MSDPASDPDFPDLRLYPKVHPRSILTEKAGRELSGAVLDIKLKYKLSFAELFYILSDVQHHWSGLVLGVERDRNREPREADR